MLLSLPPSYKGLQKNQRKDVLLKERKRGEKKFLMKNLNVFIRKEELSVDLCNSGGRGTSLRLAAAPQPPRAPGRGLLPVLTWGNTHSFISQRMRPHWSLQPEPQSQVSRSRTDCLPGSCIGHLAGTATQEFPTWTPFPAPASQLWTAVQLQSSSAQP